MGDQGIEYTKYSICEELQSKKWAVDNFENKNQEKAMRNAQLSYSIVL